MHPDLMIRACDLYQTSPAQLTALSGGNYNATNRYPLQEKRQSNAKMSEGRKYGVLRIGVEDCPTEQTLGMLEWVRFLSENGAPVAEPIVSAQGRLLERLEADGKVYTITAFKEVDGTLAERIPQEEWTDELLRSIGRATGKMHAISKRYQPSHQALNRPHWWESYEIHKATQRLGETADPARDKLPALVAELKRLPVDPDGYGLIHGDLHFANFLVRLGGGVTIIDFDDCQYGWFAMDIAMALFDVLVLYNARSEMESKGFARIFMQHYLAGYREENVFERAWQVTIPHFLKLKELCVYAALIGHPDIERPESWVGRYMRGRAERIAAGITYVEIDFDNI